MCQEHFKESFVQLKSGGLKVTSARLSLLDIFKHAKKPVSVRQISRQLKQPDVATLYRNIDALTDLGLIKKISLGKTEGYYELNAAKHHHHLICKVCGRIADVEGCKVSVADKNFASHHGFAKVTDHSLEFFGVCKLCAKKTP